MWLLCEYCVTTVRLLCDYYYCATTIWHCDPTMWLQCYYYVTTMQLANTMCLLCYYFVMFCWIFNTNTNTSHFTWYIMIKYIVLLLFQNWPSWWWWRWLLMSRSNATCKHLYFFKGSTVKVKRWLQRLSSRSFGDGDEVIGEIPNHGESPLVMDIGDEDVKVKSM